MILPAYLKNSLATRNQRSFCLLFSFYFYLYFYYFFRGLLSRLDSYLKKGPECGRRFLFPIGNKFSKGYFFHFFLNWKIKSCYWDT